MKSAVYGAETAQMFAMMRWVVHGDEKEEEESEDRERDHDGGAR